jgi:ubiquinone/menaquinone biosynthesis C-methylase UbiE
MTAPRGPDEAPDVADAYDRWAPVYDEDANRTRDLAGVALRSAGLDLDGRDVVEAGCGTGRNTVWLAEHARGVLGLDVSDGMLRRARERVNSPRVRFVRHDVRSAWPVGDGAADVVVSMLILEHVERLPPVFAEAARVLRPGGRLFVAEHHPTRQLLGSQAWFTDPGTGEPERVAAFLHHVSEYVEAGLGAGLELRHLGEPRDPGAARTEPPRLVTLRFAAPG